MLDRNCIVKKVYYMTYITYIIYYIDSIIYFHNIGGKDNVIEIIQIINIYIS